MNDYPRASRARLAHYPGDSSDLTAGVEDFPRKVDPYLSARIERHFRDFDGLAPLAHKAARAGLSIREGAGRHLGSDVRAAALESLQHDGASLLHAIIEGRIVVKL